MGGPVVGEVDGEYHYDHKHSVLEWQLTLIDASNKSGSMEFSIAGHPGDFFPLTVSFMSSKSYSGVKVSLICCLSSLHTWQVHWLPIYHVAVASVFMVLFKRALVVGSLGSLFYMICQKLPCSS